MQIEDLNQNDTRDIEISTINQEKRENKIFLSDFTTLIIILLLL